MAGKTAAVAPTPAPVPTALPPPPAPPAAKPSKDDNVVVLTLDGVRYQDVFDEAGHIRASGSPQSMPYVHKAATRPHTILVGASGSGNTVSISNERQLSLPGYKSIFAGKDTGCMDNGDIEHGETCGRASEETLQERLVHSGMRKEEVVTIASWSKLSYSAESVVGTTTVNAGVAGSNDGHLEPHERGDAETFALSMDYLKTKHPRFMFISLNDPDHFAHGAHDQWKEASTQNYLSSLSESDRYIALLEAELKKIQAQTGRATTLIVLTDHGRGNGDKWDQHGPEFKEAKRIWLYSSGPHVDPMAAHDLKLSHVDVRPTVETLVGLKPLAGPGRGKPIKAITGDVAKERVTNR